MRSSLLMRCEGQNPGKNRYTAIVQYVYLGARGLKCNVNFVLGALLPRVLGCLFK